jgi:GH18 family chitinase
MSVGFSCVLVLWQLVALGQQPSSADRLFRVVGYLPDYRLTDYDLGRATNLTDLTIFSAEPTADGNLNLTRLQNCPWPALLKFKTTHRVRLILAIGGWERSEHFAVVACSTDLRRRFVNEVLAFCHSMRLDGVDLDWEHPKGDQQERSYALLLNELRTAFKSRGLLLTVTVAAWQKLTPEAVDAVDFVQVMAYDHDLQHSTFDGARNDVERLRAAHVPSGKIVLGLPFYGRDIRNRDATTYSDIAAKFRLDPDVNEVQGVYFNGPGMIRRKTQYAMESGLGGVMIWELGQDATGENSLLDVVQETLKD